MRPLRLLSIAPLLLCLSACGGGSSVPDARRQLVLGRLDAAERLLEGDDSPEAARLRDELRATREARQAIEDDLRAFREDRDGRELDDLLATLDRMLEGTDDPVSREAIKTEKSRTADWDAEGRAGSLARRTRHDGDARPPRPGEVTDPRPSEPLAQLLVDEARAQARDGRFAAAARTLEQALEGAPGSALLEEALLEVRAKAEVEAHAVLDLVRAQENVGGPERALETLTARARDLPPGVLDGRLGRREQELRAAAGLPPVPATPTPGPGEGAEGVAGADPGAEDGPSSAVGAGAAGAAGGVPAAEVAVEDLPRTLEALPDVDLDPTLYTLDPAEVAVRAAIAEEAGDLPRARGLWHVAARGAYGPERLRYDAREYAVGCRELMRNELRRAGLAGPDGLDWQGARVPWAGVSGFALAHLAQEGVLEGDGRVGLALERATRGTEKDLRAGLGALHDLLDEGVLGPELCHSLVAQVRGEPLPEGGYLWHDDGWLSRVEFERETIGPEAEALARIVRTSRGEKREKALAALDELADEYRFVRDLRAETLTRALEDRTRDLTRSRELKRLIALAGQRTQLDLAREHALELIYDEVQYFYPVPDDRRAEYEVVQREVDARVAAVRALWDEPVVVPLPDEFREDLEDLFLYLNLLRSGSLPEGLPSWLEGVDWTLEQADLGSFAWDANERAALAMDRAVRALNEARWAAGEEARPEEAQQVRVTNAYRRMMGRPALAWDPRIQVAARIHSDYMARTGNFGHFEEDVPEHRTPFDRMRVSDYPEGASENCHVGSGSPEGAHHGWTHSSGHHRNLLMAGHEEMATAVAGNYWTQNFGVGKSHRAELPPLPASPWQD